jgi:uncharacterized SAM-binding protein YcdF (DUF218 family)
MSKQQTVTYFRYSFFCILALFSLWIIGLVRFVNTIPTTIEDNDSETDGIVILTGGSNRLDTGIKLLNEHKAKKLFISGVGKETNLATLLILSGNLPDNIAFITENIELGYEAKNTKENAGETAKWVKENNYKSIRLVTSNYHINRSLTEFKKQMPDVKIISNPVIPDNFTLKEWWRYGSMKKLLVMEYTKYLFSELFPFN